MNNPEHRHQQQEKKKLLETHTLNLAGETAGRNGGGMGAVPGAVTLIGFCVEWR